MDDTIISLLASRIALGQEYISVNTGMRVAKDKVDSHKYRNDTYKLVSNHKGELNETIKILEGDIFKYAVKVYNRYNTLGKDDFINVNPSARSSVISKPNNSYIRGKNLRICYNRHSDDKNNQSRLDFVNDIERILKNVPGFKWAQQKPVIHKSGSESLESSSRSNVSANSMDQFMSPVLLGLVDTTVASPRKSLQKSRSSEPKLKTVDEVPVSSKSKKQSIPPAIKKRVFNEYCGRDAREGRCFCCKARISSDSFSCAHVVPEKYGGEVDLSNLRPVCVTCNSSMGTMILHEYMVRQNYELPETNPDEMSWIWLAKAIVMLEKIGENKLTWDTKKEKAEYSKLTNPKKDIRVRLSAFMKAFKL